MDTVITEAYYDDKLERVIENGQQYTLDEWAEGKPAAVILKVLSAPTKAKPEDDTDDLGLQEPMFRTVTFENMLLTDKKPAKLSVRINLGVDNVIYTDRRKSRAEVVGFVMPNNGTEQAGLFVHETQKPEGDAENNTYHLFRLEAAKYALAAIDDECKRISNLPDETRANYKDLSVIRRQLLTYLQDKNDFYNDLHKQINIVTSRRLPRLNEYVMYADDKTAPFKVTARVPYNNPMKQDVTDKQKRIVDTVLDEFFDEDNKLALAWYFGAALSNVDIHDDRVSKLMVVSSARGGCGKSSLLTGLTKVLFGETYSDITPSFDEYFSSNNRFATSTLPMGRMTVYSEAQFADVNISDGHDFKGLNSSTIKSLITDGYMSDEKKNQDAVIKRVHGLHVVLSNYAPKITDATEALRRRLLPVVVKPSRMQDKASGMGLVGQNKFNQYLEDNAQAFANYFVSVFKANEYMFTYDDYDEDDFQAQIDESDAEVRETERNASKARKESIDAITKNDIKEAIKELAQLGQIPDVSDIISDISLAISNGLIENMRVDGNDLYIDSSKKAFSKYGAHSESLRKLMIEKFGPTVRKFQKRMIKVDLLHVK